MTSRDRRRSVPRWSGITVAADHPRRQGRGEGGGPAGRDGPFGGLGQAGGVPGFGGSGSSDRVGRGDGSAGMVRARVRREAPRAADSTGAPGRVSDPGAAVRVQRVGSRTPSVRLGRPDKLGHRGHERVRSLRRLGDTRGRGGRKTTCSAGRRGSRRVAHREGAAIALRTPGSAVRRFQVAGVGREPEAHLAGEDAPVTQTGHRRE